MSERKEKRERERLTTAYQTSELPSLLVRCVALHTCPLANNHTTND